MRFSRVENRAHEMGSIRLLAGGAIFILLGIVLGTPPAVAWGCKGHQTVALIAERHLTPEARQLVDKLLEENPVDPLVNAIAVPRFTICWRTAPPGRMTCATNARMVRGITSIFRAALLAIPSRSIAARRAALPRPLPSNGPCSRTVMPNRASAPRPSAILSTSWLICTCLCTPPLTTI